MGQIASMDKSNQATSKDWLEVTKNLVFSTYESYVVQDNKQEDTFTKTDFEAALKKVSRRIKK